VTVTLAVTVKTVSGRFGFGDDWSAMDEVAKDALTKRLPRFVE
jgi:hypothetical protein